jgi:hypothetical protein
MTGEQQRNTDKIKGKLLPKASRYLHQLLTTSKDRN